MNNFSARFTTLKAFFQTQQWPTLGVWKNLFTVNYWAQNPPPISSPYLFLTIIIVALIVIFLAFWLIKLRRAERELPVFGGILTQLQILVIFTAVTNIIYLFFREQSISYLCSPWVFLLIWTLIILWWLGVYIYYRRAIPVKIAQYQQQMRFKRYLPATKKAAIGSKIN